MRKWNREARRCGAGWAAVVFLSTWAPPAVADDKCEQHGTAINWLTSQDSAWRLAGEQVKPVFLLHVSGNFAKQDFT